MLKFNRALERKKKVAKNDNFISNEMRYNADFKAV